MNLNTNIYKKVIFPLIFFIKRLDVAQKMKTLSEIDAHLFSNISEIQESKLLKLLKVCFRESGYFKSIVNPTNNKLSEINYIDHFPILTKEIIRNEIEVSVGTKRKGCITRMTAGTTGTPVSIRVDKNTLSWQLATRYFLFGWHGIFIGDREARFWGRPLQGVNYYFKDLLLNRKRFSFCGNTKKDVVVEYEKLLKFKPDYFYGYSSLILNAAIACEENNLEIPKIKAIICTAEMLGKQQRKYIERVFKCPVIVEYGCTESDIIAFECQFGKLHVMSHNILIDETLAADGRMVYTDLNNSAMPLIRYELGDRIKMDTNNICKCNRSLPIISHLEGRTVGQILTFPDGSTTHAVSFAYLIEDIANDGFEVSQFKILYDNNELIFHINIKDDIERFENEMRRGIDKIVKNKVKYHFKYGVIKSNVKNKYSYFEQK